HRRRAAGLPGRGDGARGRLRPHRLRVHRAGSLDRRRRPGAGRAGRGAVLGTARPRCAARGAAYRGRLAGHRNRNRNGRNVMIIEGVRPFAGQHCETTTLGVPLYHTGVELSEPMWFGLGAGWGFIYWDAMSMAFPFVGGRTKPTLISRGVATRLGVTLRA